MATFVFFDEFKANVTSGVIDLSSDQLGVALTNTAPDAANDVDLSDITEINAGNGYTAGGEALTSGSWAETGSGTGVWQYDSDNVVWTATGGDMDTFRYVVLYDMDAANDELIGYIDYGSSITVTDTNTFTVDVGANGWFQLDG